MLRLRGPARGAPGPHRAAAGELLPGPGRLHRRSVPLLVLQLLLPWALSPGLGCSSDALFGTGEKGAEANVTTPAGVQAGRVEVFYTLKGADVTSSDIEVSYSLDGRSFRKATGGAGGEGTQGLSVSEAGDLHTFIWDSGADLQGARESSVLLRVRPENGVPDISGPIFVHNARYLLAAENASVGRARLLRLDVVAAEVRLLRTVATGGTSPADVLFFDGYFLVTHTGSNDVAVFKLDEPAETLTPTAASPVGTGGVGARYLAAASGRVFVSNATGGSISIFDFDSSTGTLALNANSGVLVSGCQGIALRSGRLYVARESADEVVIFDVASDGELLLNGASPVTTGGLSAPRGLVVAGTRLYVTSADTASVAGFNFQGSGDLSPIGGSPFSASVAGLEQLARLGTKLFGVNGVGGSFLFFTISATGVLTEDLGSPVALGSDAFCVAASGSAVVAGVTTGERLHLWTVDEAGAVATSPFSPYSAGLEVVGLAISN